MSTASPILAMAGVAKSFETPGGRVEVLRSVDVAVRQGEFVAVTGPSGSGKSTFLNLAALLDGPTLGRISFEGRDVSTLDEAGLCNIRKRKIGMVFQNFHLLPHRSALENVAFRFRYLAVENREAQALSEKALSSLGLMYLAGRAVRLLSGGEMQRVAIARAVALRPALLLADEPTGNLDRSSAERVMEAFMALNAEGISIVLATHNRGLLQYCSRHLVCRDGSIKEETL